MIPCLPFFLHHSYHFAALIVTDYAASLFTDFAALLLTDYRGKVPMIKPIDNFELVPFDKLNGSLTELTHFFVDYSKSPAVMCVEYNHNGPRISDIEYYFRQIAHDELHLARKTLITTFMDMGIDKTIDELVNVLNFDIKLKPQSIAQMDNDVKGYITSFANLGQLLKPNFIRVEASFQTPGSKVKSQHLNKEANTMMQLFLNKFKSRPFHIDQFEDFEITYTNKDGEDATFNLIKGKKEIKVEIPRDQHLTARQWYELIEKEFDNFITSV